MGQKEKPRESRPRNLPPVPRWLPEYKLLEDAGAISDDHVALALLLMVRDLRLWVESTPAERPRLLLPPSPSRLGIIQKATAHKKGVAEALDDLSAIRSDPKRATSNILSTACRRISRWADRRSLSHVALSFAEAAARVDPYSSKVASDAARAARHDGYPDRAECWYDRAISLAARDGSRNRSDMISALLGKGTLLREQCRFDEARQHLSRAAKLCASTRRYRLAAETQHDLLGFSIIDGSYFEAEDHMMLALDYYPVHHPAITRLVRDWAFHLIQHALYSQAVPLLQASISQIRRWDILVLSWGTLAHAAAGIGRRDLYDEAVQQVVEHADRAQEFAAAALAHAANGACFFAEWEIGQAQALRAREVARARMELETVEWVREILAAIELRQVPPAQREPPHGSRLDVIADRIFKQLEARKRPRRRPVQVDPQKETGGPPMPTRRRGAYS